MIELLQWSPFRDQSFEEAKRGGELSSKEATSERSEILSIDTSYGDGGRRSA